MRALLVAAAVLAVGCSGSGSGSLSPVGPVIGGATLLPIDAVDIRVSQSEPQIVVHVRGSLPNGCAHLDAVTQRRFSNGASLAITMIRPPDLDCSPQVGTVELDIPLAGAFTPGVYRIYVNLREYSVEL
jgi:hypothetical protein